MFDCRTLHLLFWEELFARAGVYGHPFPGPWRPTPFFRESETCINLRFTAPFHSRARCSALGFVAEQKRCVRVPCHQIRLRGQGQPVAWLYRSGRQGQRDDAVHTRLKTTVNKLKREEKGHAVP